MNSVESKATKEKKIFLDLNEIIAISSTDHPELSVIIKNSKGKLMVTINDSHEKKK